MSESAISNEERYEFALKRSEALNVYTRVEASLCLLFETVATLDRETAELIFYKIVNTSSRLQILDALLKKNIDSSYEAYWEGIPNTPNRRGLVHLLRDIDAFRNKIAHWVLAATISAEGARLGLVRPNIWADESSEQITTEDIVSFIEKADWVSRSVNTMAVYLKNTAGQDQDWRRTWHGIFQQPCTYPPTTDHPLG
jgi:hypothetical protein